MNSDEASKCLQLGKEYFAKGEYENALKYFDKAYKLDKVIEAFTLMSVCKERIKQAGGSTSTNGNSHSEEPKGHSSHHTQQNAQSAPSGPKNTGEKPADIKKILNTKDFYEILGVTKSSTEDEIKKAYKKLALKYHPDKNHAPGADEAFKKIAQAYDCLTNADKRQKYDQYGNEEPEQHYQHYRQYYGEEVSPEDIFQMFFGNAFFQQGPRRRTHFRTNFHHQRHEDEDEHQEQYQQQQRGGQRESIYSLYPTGKFNIQRDTRNLRVKYYVDASFTQKYNRVNKITAFEEDLERQYLINLNNQCNQNKNNQKMLRKRAEYSSGQTRAAYEEQARNVDLSSCRHVEDARRQFPHLFTAGYYY